MCEDDNTVREGPQFVEIGADDEGAALGATVGAAAAGAFDLAS